MTCKSPFKITTHRPSLFLFLLLLFSASSDAAKKRCGDLECDDGYTRCGKIKNGETEQL